MPAPRVLLVASRTATDPPLTEAVRRRARRGEAVFHLVVPATPHGLHRVVDPEVAGLDEARRRLELALPVLSEAAGRPVTGHVGDANPLAAVEDAVHLRGFDEIIISTLPSRLSRWLRIDVPSKVRALGLPTLHVAGDADAAYEGWLPTASSILQAGLRCVVEVWGDTPELRWYPRLLICDDDLEGVEAAIEEWIAATPQHSARVAGYTRDRLARVDAAPTALCHVAGVP